MTRFTITCQNKSQEAPLPRKHKKKPQPIRPTARTLPDIEADAVREGNEILLGPRKIKVVRTIVTYEPCPEAGPGRWQVTHVDEIIEAALEAAKYNGLTPSMFRALTTANFEAIEPLRRRVHGSSASKT